MGSKGLTASLFHLIVFLSVYHFFQSVFFQSLFQSFLFNCFIYYFFQSVSVCIFQAGHFNLDKWLYKILQMHHLFFSTQHYMCFVNLYIYIYIYIYIQVRLKILEYKISTSRQGFSEHLSLKNVTQSYKYHMYHTTNLYLLMHGNRLVCNHGKDV